MSDEEGRQLRLGDKFRLGVHPSEVSGRVLVLRDLLTWYSAEVSYRSRDEGQLNTAQLLRLALLTITSFGSGYGELFLTGSRLWLTESAHGGVPRGGIGVDDESLAHFGHQRGSIPDVSLPWVS